MKVRECEFQTIKYKDPKQGDTTVFTQSLNGNAIVVIQGKSSVELYPYQINKLFELKKRWNIQQ